MVTKGMPLDIRTLREQNQRLRAQLDEANDQAKLQLYHTSQRSDGEPMPGTMGDHFSAGWAHLMEAVRSASPSSPPRPLHPHLSPRHRSHLIMSNLIELSLDPRHH